MDIVHSIKLVCVFFVSFLCLLFLKVSQKYDKSYMEDKEMQARRIQDINQQLKSNSMDIQMKRNAQDNEEDDLSMSDRDYDIGESASI